ncbi:hypothetical protein [Rhodopila globiformis]|uniref:Uncharacterized protein n=1 Tax=Rhodopila globiformis TaxID=1071 RepID=A0A2S6N7J7_RHOGL|nr:hypothetical protein [Rhodopila globiformis]PPQ30579.1 hypothetical protein CCS01_18885 [Rhodopila globiformis]
MTGATPAAIAVPVTIAAMTACSARGGAPVVSLPCLSIMAGSPADAWEAAALADLTGLHMVTVAESIRWLHRHKAIRIATLATGELGIFPIIETLTAGPPAKAGSQIRPRGRPRLDAPA